MVDPPIPDSPTSETWISTRASWLPIRFRRKFQTPISTCMHTHTQNTYPLTHSNTLAGAAYLGSWLLGYLALTVWAGPRVLLFSCSLGSALKHLTSCPFFKNLKGYYQVPLKQLWFRARHVLWQRHREQAEPSRDFKQCRMKLLSIGTWEQCFILIKVLLAFLKLLRSRRTDLQ